MAAYIAMSISESNINIANNTSVITVVLYYYGNGVSWNSGSPYGEITIAGSTYGFRHNFTTSTGAQYLGEYSKTVTHDSAGGGSVACSAAFWTDTDAAGTLRTSRTVTLTTIPRASDIALSKTSIAADGVDTVVVTATKKNSSFTDTLVVKLGDYTQDITSGTAFTIPKDWINAISGTSATADVTVTTKNGSTVVGTNTVKLTVNVPDTIVPAVNSVTVSEAITSTKSAFGVFVTDISKLNVSVSASGVHGSTIQSVKTVFDNVTYDGTSFQTSSISKSGTLNMVTTVTDSRGRSASYTKEVTVYQYSAPKIISASSVSDGENTVVTVTGAVSPVMVGSTAKNNKTLKISYKSSTEIEFANETTVEVADWSFAVSKTFEIDSRMSTYDFKISLEDKISTADPYYTTTGKPVISRYAGGDGVTLFEEATSKGFRVGNGQSATFTGDILIDDPELESLWNEVFGGGLTRRLIDFIYPLGSVIASVNSSFDPNVAYKTQTWVRFAEGRTLVGADSSDEDFSTAEKTGGEKTHTLTTNEIPEHGNHLLTSFPGGYGNTAVYLSAATMSAYGNVARGWNNLNGGEMYPAGYLVGGSKPHNNMQPYTTVYYWKRTA